MIEPLVLCGTLHCIFHFNSHLFFIYVHFISCSTLPGTCNLSGNFRFVKALSLAMNCQSFDVSFAGRTSALTLSRSWLAAHLCWRSRLRSLNTFWWGLFRLLHCCRDWMHYRNEERLTFQLRHWCYFSNTLSLLVLCSITTYQDDFIFDH